MNAVSIPEQRFFKKGVSKISLLSQLEPLLLQVQKPAQYIGGEIGSIRKELSPFLCGLPFVFQIRMKSVCRTSA